MEMEEITEAETNVGGTSAAKPEDKSKGETETELYSSLNSPTEDLYAEAQFLPDPSKKKSGFLGHPDGRLWRRMTLCFGATCLLLIIIIVLVVFKLKPVTSCQEPSVKPQPILIRTCVGCPTTSERCPEHWLEQSDSCFYLSGLRAKWDQAQDQCVQMGGALAQISSRSEQHFLTENGKNREYWIGLKYDRLWTWVNGATLTQSYWSDDQPGGNCALLASRELQDKNWFRDSCTRPNYFICKQPATDK